MPSTIDLDDLLTTKETSAVLGVKPNTLEIWRHKGKGPPFVRLGDEPGVAVRYLRSELKAWLAARSSRSEASHA
jgi:predicted DNA-binding transcriptional regulator AlpA